MKNVVFHFNMSTFPRESPCFCQTTGFRNPTCFSLWLYPETAPYFAQKLLHILSRNCIQKLLLFLPSTCSRRPTEKNWLTSLRFFPNTTKEKTWTKLVIFWYIHPKFIARSKALHNSTEHSHEELAFSLQKLLLPSILYNHSRGSSRNSNIVSAYNNEANVRRSNSTLQTL